LNSQTATSLKIEIQACLTLLSQPIPTSDKDHLSRIVTQVQHITCLILDLFVLLTELDLIHNSAQIFLTLNGSCCVLFLHC
jgi:hypothetical protein